jgi:uncharacterized membrane protein
MERSLVLAKLIGPLFLTIGLGLLLNQNTYWAMINEVIRHPTPIGSMLIYLSGLLSMLAGLAMVNAHSVWVRDWPVLIKSPSMQPVPWSRIERIRGRRGK